MAIRVYLSSTIIKLKKKTLEEDVEKSNIQLIGLQQNYILSTSQLNLNKNSQEKATTPLNKELNFILFLKFKLNLLNNEEKVEVTNLISKIEISSLLKLKKEKNLNSNDSDSQSLFYSLDILSDHKNYFNYKNKSTVKTKLGGVLTIIIFLAFIPLIYLVNLDYWNHVNPKIRTSLVTENSELYKDKINIVSEINNFTLTITMDSNMKDDFQFINSSEINPKSNPEFTKIDNKYITTYPFYNAFYLVYQHKCIYDSSLLEIQDICNLDRIYNYDFSIKYKSFDQEHLGKFPEIYEINKNFTTNAYKTPYYHALFNKLLLYDNTGNIFEMEAHKEYFLNILVIDGIRKNKQWSVNNREALEFLIDPQLDNEIKIVSYKTLSEVVIDSFSVISLMVIFFKTVCYYYADFNYIKMLNEDHNLFSSTTDANSVNIMNYLLDILYFAPKLYSSRKNYLLERISLENFN